MIRRFTHVPAHAAAWVAAAALSLGSASGAAQGAKQSLGLEFDMKTTMNVTGGMAAMLGGMSPGYTAHGMQIGRRTRIDIIDGAIPPLAEKGDYILFDTSGITIVHPSKKEFVPIPKDFASKALEQMQAMGMSVGVGGISVTLDSLPGTDTIAGLPTRHYRSTIAYSMTIEGMGQSQKLSTKATGDYWMATVPGLSTSPLQETSSLGAGATFTVASSGPFKDLAVKADSVMRKMTGTAVRTRTTSDSDTGAGAMSMEVGSELLNLKHSQIAESLFVVPSDYTKGASPFPSHH